MPVPQKPYAHPAYVSPFLQVNPWYSSTYVFANDFPALLDDCPDPPTTAEHPLMKVAPAKGAW